MGKTKTILINGQRVKCRALWNSVSKNAQPNKKVAHPQPTGEAMTVSQLAGLLVLFIAAMTILIVIQNAVDTEILLSYVQKEKP